VRTKRVGQVGIHMQVDTKRFEKGLEQAAMNVRKLKTDVYLASELGDDKRHPIYGVDQPLGVLTFGEQESRKANGNDW
jgi:hypothetical protein